MTISDRDAAQVIRASFNEAQDCLDVFVQGGTISTAGGGLSVISTHYIPFSSIPNSASSPFEVTPSLSSAVKRIMIYDTTGETIEFRTGALTGTLLFYTGPGQDVPIDAAITSGSRVSIRSHGSAPTAGEYIITFLG